MLKLKDDIPLEKLIDYGFELDCYQRGWLAVYRDRLVKIWVDKHKIIHYNAPTIKEFDLIYKMHDLIEYTDNSDDLRMVSKYNMNNRIDKAIKVLENYNVFCDDNILNVAINILKGSDKE